MPRTDARQRAAAAIVAALLFVSGSFLGAGPALSAECEGDDCQTPPTAPDDPVPPTSAVQGPPNPPVRFPKSQRHKPPRHKQDRDAGRDAR